MLPVPSAIEQDKIVKDNVKNQIEDVIHNQVALKQIGATSVNVHDSDQGLVVSLHEAGFFNSGSADIRPRGDGYPPRHRRHPPHQAMRVEGHTDDIPIHTAQFATNWELSTARAAGITRLLIAQHAVDPSQISATGYAEFHPRRLKRHRRRPPAKPPRRHHPPQTAFGRRDPARATRAHRPEVADVVSTHRAHAKSFVILSEAKDPCIFAFLVDGP